MSTLPQLYRHSLALLTDLYQLTMAYGYWKTGVAEREAVFHLTFRTCPFGGAYAVACGLSYVVDWLRDLRFDQDDLRYLATLTGADDRPLFEAAFLDELAGMQFRCDVDAVPEGTVVFPHQPLVRVRGPILQAQLLETALLTIVNFQTLVATKAARLCGETPGDMVIEFGLRRAQGIDGGIAASRAAFVGGCAATSNVLAGKLFDIPIKGTHAHSWVMSFDSELESFRAYAAALPNNCVFLVDTFDTLQGVRHAVEVRMREQGHEMLGIRLDSGDLAELSIAARKILDEGGFPNAAIVASNDLDEHIIRDLKHQGATITVWGVGTRLATAYDQPALGGIYKLSAIRDSAGGQWQHKIKLSEQPIKVSTPGILQVRRFSNDGGFLGDVIYDELTGIAESPTVVDFGGHAHRQIAPTARHEDLLVPVFRQGKSVYNVPTAAEAQQRTKQQLDQLPDATKRLHNPTPYPVGLEENLYLLKSRLIDEARNNKT
jgi:nicotinate phosphoribosyltransferase